MILRSFVLGAALCAGFATLVAPRVLRADGETPPQEEGTPEGAPDDEPPFAKRESVAELKLKLDARFDELNKIAEQLAADYVHGIELRIDELKEGNATLEHLFDSDIFTPATQVRGLPKDPLARLPWLRRKLESIDQEAADLQQQFGGEALARNHKAAIVMMKKIRDAQSLFRQEDRDGNGILDYATDLAQLSREGLFEKGAKNGYAQSGYSFRIIHGDVLTYTAEAAPKDGQTGVMFYFLDHSNVIRENKGRTANAGSTPIPDQK